MVIVYLNSLDKAEKREGEHLKYYSLLSLLETELIITYDHIWDYSFNAAWNDF